MRHQDTKGIAQRAPPKQKVRARVTVLPPHPVTIVGLKVGGRVPLWLLANHTLLLDRCIVIRLNTLARSKRLTVEADRYWLAQLNDRSLKLNIGLCSLEGAHRRPLNFEEFFAEHDTTSQVLRALLPQSTVVSYAPEDRNNVYAVQVGLETRYRAESEFLCEFAPQIAARRSESDRTRIERQMLDSARRLNLMGRSLVLLACLSCLYEDKRDSSGASARAVLKPKMKYSAEHAHNAICDLRFLEILTTSSTAGVGPVALCTADPGLAAFWVQLGVREPERTTTNSFGYEFNADRKLFPGLSKPELSRLMALLRADEDSTGATS